MKVHIDWNKRHSEKKELSPESLAKINELITHVPEGKHKSVLMRALHLAQIEFGWVSIETMNYIADLLKIQPIEVYEVATFYM
jgi:NADH-quinone oxidoreductase subunit E